MSQTEQHLKRLLEKLQLLLKQQVALQKENDLLRDELNETRKKWVSSNSRQMSYASR